MGGEVYVGYRPLLDGDVHFVHRPRRGGALWFVVHAVAGVGAGALVAVAWRLVRHRG